MELRRMKSRRMKKDSQKGDGFRQDKEIKSLENKRYPETESRRMKKKKR